MSARKIVIDGITYNSVDEMSEDVRRNYEEAMRGVSSTMNAPSNPMEALNNVFADTNNNGMPDVLENQPFINISSGMKFVVDGKTYNSLDHLPPDARARYEQAMGALDKNQNGMPDFLEGMMDPSTQSAQTTSASPSYPPNTTRHASRTPLSSSPAIAPDTFNGWMLALAALFVLMICGLATVGFWYFFLR